MLLQNEPYTTFDKACQTHPHAYQTIGCWLVLWTLSLPTDVQTRNCKRGVCAASEKARNPQNKFGFLRFPGVFRLFFAKQILAKVEVIHRGVTIESTPSRNIFEELVL